MGAPGGLAWPSVRLASRPLLALAASMPATGANSAHPTVAKMPKQQPKAGMAFIDQPLTRRLGVELSDALAPELAVTNRATSRLAHPCLVTRPQSALATRKPAFSMRTPGAVA